MGVESAKSREEIKARQEELAEEILRLHYRKQPELEKRYDERCRELCLQDIQYHLSYLAEAVSSSSASLFVDYIEWVRVLLSGLGLPEEDLAINLRCMREVLLDRLSGMGRDVLQACLDDAMSRLEHPQQEPHSFIDVEQPLGGLARNYLDSLMEGDRGRALGLVKDASASGIGLKGIYLHVFQPCQQELGRLWHTGRISVAQEHFCTAATQLIMSQLYPLVFDSDKKGLRCVAACVSGELHELGIRMVSDFLEMEGWDTYYLGANSPASGILSAIEEKGPICSPSPRPWLITWRRCAASSRACGAIPAARGLRSWSEAIHLTGSKTCGGWSAPTVTRAQRRRPWRWPNGLQANGPDGAKEDFCAA
jgi:methanogenic corrinoid protein MtbC1